MTRRGLGSSYELFFFSFPKKIKIQFPEKLLTELLCFAAGVEGGLSPPSHDRPTRPYKITPHLQGIEPASCTAFSLCFLFFFGFFFLFFFFSNS